MVLGVGSSVETALRVVGDGLEANQWFSCFFWRMVLGVGLSVETAVRVVGDGLEAKKLIVLGMGNCP